MIKETFYPAMRLTFLRSLNYSACKYCSHDVKRRECQKRLGNAWWGLVWFGGCAHLTDTG